MTQHQARRVLKCCDEYIGAIHPKEPAILDGHFTIEELEAVVVLMKYAREEGRTIQRDEFNDSPSTSEQF